LLAALLLLGSLLLALLLLIGLLTTLLLLVGAVTACTAANLGVLRINCWCHGLAAACGGGTWVVPQDRYLQ
jgi:hypothetical protein